MFCGAGGDEVEVAGGGLRVGGVGTAVAAAVSGRRVARGGDRLRGCKEGVGFEGRRGGMGWDNGGGGGERMAIYDDVVVRGAASFSGDDVGEVGRGEFVDDANEAFRPGVFVVVIRLEEGCFFGCDAVAAGGGA